MLTSEFKRTLYALLCNEKEHSKYYISTDFKEAQAIINFIQNCNFCTVIKVIGLMIYTNHIIKKEERKLFEQETLKLLKIVV